MLQRAIQNKTLPGLACLLVTTAFLFVCPSVRAMSPAEYQQKLKQAITALDTLAQIDEDETEDDFNARVGETIEAVRVALPEKMTVEVDGSVCFIDNTSLHQSLEDLKRLAALNQFEKIDETVEKINYINQTLHAIEARVAERDSATARKESKAEEKSRLDTILARPEYAGGGRGPNALTRLIQDVLRWIQKLFPKPRAVAPGRANLINLVARVVVIALVSAVLIYVGFNLLRRFGPTRRAKAPKKRGPRIVLGERLEPEATATDLLSQAETLARNGDLRAAIRKAYIALLVELGDRKMISLAQHKTNRDYLNSVKNVPPLHATMRGLTDSFERHWYGFEIATPDDWQDFRAGYFAALQAEN